MKYHFLVAILLFCAKITVAQFQIGHTTITFIDATRSNRPIQTEIYYPANAAGNDVPMAGGAFPVVNFGHGFVMVWSAYQNIWESLVPAGFTVCFPRTEGNLSPNHTEFAKDLAFLCTAMTAQNTTSSSIFFNHVAPSFAVMGHSMGGGCSILARQYNTSMIKCVAALAPANTNPSAITAATSIQIPSLMIAGSYDCIAPPAAHAKPIWDALLPNLCKLYVNITNASHCQFGNANTNCSLGEGASGCANPSITRAQQQALTTDILLPWLQFYLNDDNDVWVDWIALLDAANGFTKLHMCNTSAVLDEKKADFELNLLKNPISGGQLDFSIAGEFDPIAGQISVKNMVGQTLFSQKTDVISADQMQSISVENLPSGTFVLSVILGDGRVVSKMLFKN
jgi:dienelactone hydrolase